MKKMHIHATQMELLDMISSVDEDASGTIDFQEFLVLMQSRVGAGGPDQDLRNAFKHFDKNDTNYIDKQSMKRTMIEFDNPLTGVFSGFSCSYFVGCLVVVLMAGLSCGTLSCCAQMTSSTPFLMRRTWMMMDESHFESFKT
jgi:hypothetical protein